MDKRRKVEGLAKIKLALAEKYDRLAAEARSLPRKTQLRRKAEKYRRQAAETLRT